MKRILAVLLAVMLLIAVIPATSLAEGAAINSKGDVTMYHVGTQRDNLRIHSGPGTSYRIVGRLPKNTALVKLGSESKGWVKVKTMNGLEGYVSANYVKKYAYANVTTQVDPLRVRSSRSTKSDKNIKGRIPHGTTHVTVTKTNGNWAYVKYGKLTGWASLSYLRWSL